MQISKSRGKRSRKVAEKTKSLILESAMSLFCEHGYENVSIRMISIQAGVSHTAVLHHFGGKEKIWIQLSNHMIDHVTRYNQALHLSLDSNKPSHINLYLFCVKSYAHMLLNPEPLIFLLDGIRHNHAFYSHFHNAQDAAIQGLLALVKASNASGKGKVQHPDKLAWKLLASAHSLVYLQLLVNEDNTIGSNHSRCLLEHWQIVNEHLSSELSIPENEKLNPAGLSELVLPEVF